jgi:two-component system OmpR family response regulator
MSKILIIDDDYSIVELLSDVLKREGHDVESAGEAVEGMQKARSVKPQLIILDYHMPGMTGAHLFESLRRNLATHLTPILFMSGEASGDDILKEIADPEGASFLAKPVHLDDFRKAVRDLLAPGAPPEPGKP